MNRGQELELKITQTAYRAQGIAKHDNFVFFVPGTIPGQTVRARVKKLKKNYAECDLLEVLHKSDIEIDPPCPYFDSCGGCVWQHVPYEEQLKFKNQAVKDSLERIANIKGIELAPVIPAIKQYSYRNKFEFSYGYQNMWKEKFDDHVVFHDEDPSLGFHRPGKWEEIISVDACMLASEKLNKVFLLVKNWTLSQNLDVYNPKTKKGFLRQLLIRESDNAEILLNLIVKEEKNLSFYDDLVNMLKKEVSSLHVTVHAGLNDDWSSAKSNLLYGEAYLVEDLLDLKFKVSPSAFFQTNTKMAELLFKTALSFVDDSPKTILDLYCGTGVIGQIFAKNFQNAQIVGVDINPESIKNAEDNANLNEISNVFYQADKVEKCIEELLKKYHSFDLLLIDPPRSGVHPKAWKSMLSLNARDLIYISCNPSSFARDAAILTESGYTLEKVQAVDMFPQTGHIELVSKFKKSD